MTDTDAKRIERITAQHELESASHDDVSWLLSVIAERDAEIAETATLYMTTAGQLAKRCEQLDRAHEDLADERMLRGMAEAECGDFYDRITKLEAAIREIATTHGALPMVAQPSPGIADVGTVRDFCEEALR